MERPHTINGHDGRMMPAHKWTGSPLYSTQTWVTAKRFSKHERLVVTLRFDDNCRNGHMTFAATADLYDDRHRMDRGLVSSGCLHDEIAEHFPGLAPFLPYHLCSTDGPMHYIANTVYLAGDRDPWGLRAGEQRQIRNGKTGELCWVRRGVSTEYRDGPEAPGEALTVTWEPLMRTGEGKPRQLDLARKVAIWPEATDAELMQDSDALRVCLAVRLPALLARFRALMTEGCGFDWVEAPTQRDVA